MLSKGFLQILARKVPQNTQTGPSAESQCLASPQMELPAQPWGPVCVCFGPDLVSSHLHAGCCSGTVGGISGVLRGGRQ